MRWIDPVKRLRMRIGAMLLVLASSACAAEPVGERAEKAGVEAARGVSEMLYDRNLIADPQVNARMNEYVLAVSRDRVPADSVMPEFHQWLIAWARAHPDRVARARLEAGVRARGF